MEMQFDHVPPTPYLENVLDIIRKGIAKEKNNIRLKENEDIKNQKLSEAFNVLGTQNEKLWIGVGKEHNQFGIQTREDIYFYLEGDVRPRIFYIEGKRLPKANTISKEEYVEGISTSGEPSGGIERYKLGVHGEPQRLKHNGIIGYIEKKSVAEWEKIINNSILSLHPLDSILNPVAKSKNEYTSTHVYTFSLNDRFTMHHFWIDLTK